MSYPDKPSAREIATGVRWLIGGSALAIGCAACGRASGRGCAVCRQAWEGYV